VEGLKCIAVPVFDRVGRVIAGLSISFPAMRCGVDTKSNYVELLKRAGFAVSAQVGYYGPLRSVALSGATKWSGHPAK
jgi:IclR family KDG regulon transcriptional repressor